jgi:hypothetical protein
MNDTLKITLYGTYKGVEYSKSTTYSVANYCYNMLNKAGTDINLKAVLVNLLNFGSAQQVYCNYNPENLSNANLTDTHKSYANNGELVLTNNRTMSGTNNGAKFVGAGLSVNEAVEIYYGISCSDLTGVTLELDANGQHYTIEASEFTETGGSYYAYFKELKANHMRTIVTAGIYRDGQLISKVATYSIETYAASKINGGDALAELVKMMMYYGDSAKYYIENK